MICLRWIPHWVNYGISMRTAAQQGMPSASIASAFCNKSCAAVGYMFCKCPVSCTNRACHHSCRVWYAYPALPPISPTVPNMSYSIHSILCYHLLCSPLSHCGCCLSCCAVCAVCAVCVTAELIVGPTNSPAAKLSLLLNLHQTL